MDIGNALIIGATSSLARIICHQLAEQGCALQLCGRDERELNIMAEDLSIRYSVDVSCIITDLASLQFSSQAVMEQVDMVPDVAFVVVGDMGDSDHQEDVHNIANVALTNYVIPSQLIASLSERMQEHGGSIVAISSVAGDRGRQSNFVYGSAKAALSTFCEGLRHKHAVHHIPVHVMTVKPGFIDTPLTYGMKSPLIASRELVARAIIKAMRKKKESVYIPFFWRYIMLIIRYMPSKIFNKMKL